MEKETISSIDSEEGIKQRDKSRELLDGKEFNLSDKIGQRGFECICGKRVKFDAQDIPIYDVKEFIRLLNEERNNLFRTFENSGKDGQGLIEKKDWDRFMINCDKLAGDKLI